MAIHTLSRNRRYSVNDVTTTGITFGDLPSNYAIAAWWRSTDLSLANSASVTSWPSSVGGYGATSGTAPIYLPSGIGNLPTVQWNGSTTFLNLSPTVDLTGGGIGSGNWTVAVVGISNTDGQVMGSTTTNLQMRKARSGANNISLYNNSVELVSQTFSQSFTLPSLFWYVESAGVATFYESKYQRGTGTWATYPTSLNVMGKTNFGSFWLGYISEICIWSVPLTQININSLFTSYFNPRYISAFYQ